MKKLIPAIVLLLISAMIMATASYAWFSMNTQVTATGMQVKAAAEDGLLIHNELDADTAANWLVSKSASYGSLVALTPTSSSDMANWWHNKSNNPNNNAAVGTYEDLDGNSNWKRDSGDTKSGVYYIDSTVNVGTKDESEKAYVLLNKYYVKSSGDEITLSASETYQHFYINKVKVTGNSSTPDLDKALRVAVKIGSEIFIYAPFATANVAYRVNGDSSDTTAIAVTDTTNYIVNTTTAVTSIPAYTEDMADTLEVDVYIYFEGEDPNCKSANIVAALDTLDIELVFGLTTVSAS